MKNTYWETFTTPYQMGEQKHRMFVLKIIGELNNNSILDVGCGTGPIYEIIKKHNMPFKYKGTDYSQSMIKVCKDLFPEGDFEVQDMRELKEKDNSWDCVLIMHSLDHTNDYIKSIYEAGRVCKNYVFIILWRALMENGTNLNSVNRMGKKPEEKPFDDTHLQEYSLNALQKEFDKNNLKLENIISDERINEQNSCNTIFVLKKI